MKISAFILFNLLFFNLFAQDFAKIETELKLTATEVLSNKDPEVRKLKHKELYEGFKKALEQEGSFLYPFSNIENVSIQYPQDRSFRLFTWQLFIGENNYSYGGIIQMKNGKVFPLEDGSANLLTPEMLTLDAKHWYGALCYKIVDFSIGKKTYYAILGFDSFDFFSRRKMMDILFFEKDKPQFGAPLIQWQDSWGRPANIRRFYMEYSAETSVRLNWDDELQMIVFDHLIEGRGPDGGPASVPDGSYCGFKWDGEKWAYIDRLFKDDPVLENGQAPIPIPKKSEKKDIFGNSR